MFRERVLFYYVFDALRLRLSFYQAIAEKTMMFLICVEFVSNFAIYWHFAFISFLQHKLSGYKMLLIISAC